MTETPCVLSSKITITASPQETEVAQKHLGFYMHYSSFVFKALNNPAFQNFLQWMLRKEKIEEQTVKAVYVKVFPLRRKNGKGLAGNCNPARGKIQIYPKTSTFCRSFKQKFGKNAFLAYACSRARAALIHELLHLKYAKDEKRVRKLSQKYFFAFTRKKPSHDRLSLLSYMIIFVARQPMSSAVSNNNGLAAEQARD